MIINHRIHHHLPYRPLHSVTIGSMSRVSFEDTETFFPCLSDDSEFLTTRDSTSEKLSFIFISVYGCLVSSQNQLRGSLATRQIVIQLGSPPSLYRPHLRFLYFSFIYFLTFSDC